MKKQITALLCLSLLIINYSLLIAADCVPGKLIVKIKPAFRSQCNEKAIDIAKAKNALAKLEVSSTQKLFPSIKNTGKIDLSLVYEINFSSNLDAEKAAQNLMATGVFEYAEARYISYPMFTPNDANIANQWHHALIKSYEAWDIEQGDTSVVIGITDSSFDIALPDLAGNVKHNYGEIAGNSIDDDNDGYVDNFSGWDLANSDNGLFINLSDFHGTGAAAFSSATVNNSIGIGGTGFKSLFIPIKIAPNSSPTSFTHGYEGIVYAVTHGCKVVNCSWGNTTFSQFAQDVVDFATFNYDATIVASAGNATGGNTLNYPASYDHVLSVGGTEKVNTDCNFYTNNHYVDLVAPAISLYGTYSTSQGVAGYSGAGNGTSFSAPMVSGAVALVRAHFPTYNALQAAEQVKVNADNIYGLACNSALTDMLGVGRLNIEQALLGNKPSVLMTNYTLDGLNDNVAISGQSSNLVCDFINYLANATNVVATLSCSSTYITITQDMALLGSLNTLQTATNGSNPYTFDVAANTPFNQKVEFKLSFVGDGGYASYQYFTVEVNRDYINVDVNNLATTVTARGKIGYNTPYQQSGLGIQYHPQDDSSSIFVSSFMVGVSDSVVSDMVYSSVLPAPDFDFAPVSRIVRVSSPTSDFATETTFNDNGTTSDHVGVEIRQRSYAWLAAPDDNFVMLEYRIKNAGTSTINQLFAGIFADWEIGGTSNIADFDDTRDLAYSYNPDAPGVYLGIKLLSSTSANCYNFDVVAGGNGGVDLTDGFSGIEKYTSLSTPRLSAGGTTGNDISQTLSVGPFSIAANDTQVVTFALIGGSDLASLQDNADAAQTKYNGLQVGVKQQTVQAGFELFPNPAKNKCVLVLPNQTREFTVSDASGKRLIVPVKELSANRFEMNLSTLSNGIYFVKTGSEVKKLIVNN